MFMDKDNGIVDLREHEDNSITRIPIWTFPGVFEGLEELYGINTTEMESIAKFLLTIGREVYEVEWQLPKENLDVVSEAAIKSELKDANKEMNKRISRYFAEYGKEMEEISFLDIGFGAGGTTLSILDKIKKIEDIKVKRLNVVCLDIVPPTEGEDIRKAIEELERKGIEVNLILIQENMRILSEDIFEDHRLRKLGIKGFDFVVSNASIHHTQNMLNIFARIHKILRKDRYFILGEWTHPMWLMPKLLEEFKNLFIEDSPVKEKLKRLEKELLNGKYNYEIPDKERYADILKTILEIEMNKLKVKRWKSYYLPIKEGFIDEIVKEFAKLNSKVQDLNAILNMAKFWFYVHEIAKQRGGKLPLLYYEGHLSGLFIRILGKYSGFKKIRESIAGRGLNRVFVFKRENLGRKLMRVSR